jgi:hypothetical protein
MADEVTLPTEMEIASLPQWARVAFAARCARRALSLYSGIQDQYLMAARKAVAITERAASLADSPTDSRPYGRIAGRAGRSPEPALQAAANAIMSITVSFASVTSTRTAARLAVHAGVTPSSICDDFSQVSKIAITSNWSDITPVPQSVFEPVIELPLLESVSMILELHSEPDTDPHLIGEAVVKLWEVANEYHMAKGGGVLTLDEFQQFMPALVPVAPSVGS